MPQSLVTFLKYVGSELEDSEKDYEDPLVNRLQETVKKIKSDREMGARYMFFEEMLKDEFAAGKREGKLEGKLEGKPEDIKLLLSVNGMVSQSLEDKLARVSDEEKQSIII